VPEAFGPAYQIVVQGTIFDQVFVNVWHYVVFEGEGGDADPLGVAFKIAILENLVAIQNVAVEYQLMTINGERDSTEVAQIDISDLHGLVTGDCLPPYAAWAYRIARSSQEMRNGFKRFPGVSEAWQTNGEVASGTPATEVAGMGGTLKVDLSLSTGHIGVLTVPKRQWHNVPVVPIEFWIPGDVNYQNISTQNSRKFGS
jgi:hypothetical protein